MGEQGIKIFLTSTLLKVHLYGPLHLYVSIYLQGALFFLCGLLHLHRTLQHRAFHYNMYYHMGPLLSPLPVGGVFGGGLCRL